MRRFFLILTVVFCVQITARESLALSTCSTNADCFGGFECTGVFGENTCTECKDNTPSNGKWKENKDRSGGCTPECGGQDGSDAENCNYECETDFHEGKHNGNWTCLSNASKGPNRANCHIDNATETVHFWNPDNKGWGTCYALECDGNSHSKGVVTDEKYATKDYESTTLYAECESNKLSCVDYANRYLKAENVKDYKEANDYCNDKLKANTCSIYSLDPYHAGLVKVAGVNNADKKYTHEKTCYTSAWDTDDTQQALPSTNDCLEEPGPLTYDLNDVLNLHPGTLFATRGLSAGIVANTSGTQPSTFYVNPTTTAGGGNAKYDKGQWNVEECYCMVEYTAQYGLMHRPQTNREQDATLMITTTGTVKAPWNIESYNICDVLESSNSTIEDIKCANTVVDPGNNYGKHKQIPYCVGNPYKQDGKTRYSQDNSSLIKNKVHPALCRPVLAGEYIDYYIGPDKGPHENYPDTDTEAFSDNGYQCRRCNDVEDGGTGRTSSMYDNSSPIPAYRWTLLNPNYTYDKSKDHKQFVDYYCYYPHKHFSFEDATTGNNDPFHLGINRIGNLPSQYYDAYGNIHQSSQLKRGSYMIFGRPDADITTVTSP